MEIKMETMSGSGLDTLLEVIGKKIMSDINNAGGEKRRVPMCILAEHPHLKNAYDEYVEEMETFERQMKLMAKNAELSRKAFWVVFEEQLSACGLATEEELKTNDGIQIKDGVVFFKYKKEEKSEETDEHKDCCDDESDDD